MVHLVASLYSVEVDLARQIASGEPITGITWDEVAQINGKHSLDYQDIGKEETLRLLRDHSKLAADRVREFTDEELDNAAPVSLNADAPLTAQFFIEDHALRHSFHHLANIRAVLRR